MTTKLNVQHNKVTPESKAKALPHPQVGRTPAYLSPESGNNSVSKGAIKMPVDTVAKNAMKPI